MIATCSECRRCYWRYKPRWETPGFCSVFCRELWRDARHIHHEADPGIPVAILEVIKSHNRIVHGSNREDWADWAECSECERLEALHAAAIAYHMPATAAQIDAAVAMGGQR